MKKILYSLLLVLLCGAMACTENMKYKDAAVKTSMGMLSPQEGYFLELRAGSTSATTFSWIPGACEDGLPVQYEIVFFDQAKNELTRVDAGVKPQAVITHKILNQIAGTAGIDAGGSGTLYWTVVTSRGKIRETVPGEPFQLDIKRLFGFPFIPEKLYLVGSGTEGGTNPATAVPFRVLAEGEYELYTQFSNGEYLFVDDPNDPQHSYGVSGALAVEANSPLQTPGASIYRIRLDFNVRSATVEEITQVRLWICHRQTYIAGTYIGHGVWRINATLPTYQISDYGNPGDDRYQFRVTIPSLPGTNFQESWGPTNSGNDGRPSSLDAATYFYLVCYPASATDQWNPKFKFHADTHPRQVNIYVDMGADIPTHYFELL